MLAKRRSRRSRSLFKRFLLIALLALLLTIAVYVIYFSGAFNIVNVESQGEDLAYGLDLEQFKGRNILFFKLDLNLEEYPRVSTYKVEKNYLNRSIKIFFSSRERFTIWCAGEEAKKCFWVDDMGIVFSRAPDFKGPLVFRLVRDFSNRDINMGDEVLQPDFFANLKLAFKFLDDTGIVANELSLDNLKFREIVARTSSGPDILFSLEQDPSFGIGVVKSLKDSGEWNLLNYLDLRIQGRAYYSQ